MKLHVGERLPGAGPPSHPGGYVVTGVVTETPWYGLYTARKVLYNFDFSAKRPREADDKEWLNVYLRTINYPRLDDPTYVALRRSWARAEVRRILGNRTSNLWPEPLDLLEVPNTRDPFTFARDGTGSPEGAAHVSALVGTEPIIVFAQPQGEPLARWRQGVLPLSWVLSALGELLEFVRAAHGDGMLLNGLGPGSVIVDRVGRVHYLATDMVVEMTPGGRGATALGAGPSIDWARHFPPERYPRGFSAPECFDPAQPRDRRTDLYGWATIAYYLLTSDRPAQLAVQQGQPWARFEEAQFARLTRALRSVPPALVRIWAEQLSVDGDALLRGWPGNFVTALRHCLRPDRLQRPAGVADLRDWLVAPPPAPVAAALAVRIARPGPVRILLDTRGLEPSLGLVVRRGVGFLPVTPGEGDPIAEGPLRTAVDDPGLPAAAAGQPTRALAEVPTASLSYAVFTRAEQGGRVAYSVAAPAAIIDANVEDIRRCAEGNAEAGTADQPEPGVVRLLFEAFDRVALAETLLASALPQVRGWAVARLAGTAQAPAAQKLLWRALQDPIPAIRLDAARGLLGGAAAPPIPLVRQVVDALGAGNTDDCIEAARSLRQIGVTDEVIGATAAALEKERPVVCPVCGGNLQHRDRSVHLIAAHGYVDVFGTLLPRPDALARLWSRTFGQGDGAAHDRLCELLLEGPAPTAAGAGPRTPYVASLEEELLRRADSLFAARWQEMPRLVQCLRQNPKARPYFRQLLFAADPRVREAGRELVLPDLGERLAGDDTSAVDVRRELDRLCPPELIEEKIQLCLRLPHVGVDALASEGCLRALQQERPVECPQCHGAVALADLATHLRRAHKIYLFRGARRSLQDTLATLLAAVCGSSPDYEAWQTLEGIAQEEYRTGGDAFLVAQLIHTLRKLADARRGPAVASAAEAVVASGNAPHLTRLLAEVRQQPGSHAAAGHLALELAARLPPPMPNALLATVRPLLTDREVPLESRVKAAAALLRTTGKAGPAATEVVGALAASSRSKGVEYLRLLEQQVGNSPAIDEMSLRLEDQVRMVCPRCTVELQRPVMRKHLWDEHRLVLDGRRVREPWRLIEDWLEDYRLEKDIVLLERCREMAQRLEGKYGMDRLYRLLLARGIEHAEARRKLLAAARRQQTSLCPHCYATVHPHEEAAPARVTVGPGKLASGGYRVEVSDAGLSPSLEVALPDRVLHRGGAPDRWLTRKGAVLLLAGLPALAAVGLYYLLPYFKVPVDPRLPAAGAAGLAVLALLLVPFVWRPPRDPLARAIDFAWKMLVPRLHENGYSAGDAAFAAGLALASAGRGDVAARAATLKTVREEAEAALASGGSARQLAALWRLTAEDMARNDLDPVTLVVAQVGRCFAGQLPLSFAGQLLTDWAADWWTEGNLARLRVLLCARAFEAGLEVADLIDVGRSTPTLAAAVKTGEPDGLAQLRLLWSLRQARPWDRFGKNATVFDLAADAETGRSVLARYPDLLVAIEETPPIYVCARGVEFSEKMLVRPPKTVEVVAKRQQRGDGYELVLDDLRFPFAADPDALARRLERLFRYYFQEFRSQVAAARRWYSPEAAAALRGRNGVACPQCRQLVLTRVGNVGIALGAAAGREPAVGKSVG
jgi:hypothetical protein